jgi:hypothetical protein
MSGVIDVTEDPMYDEEGGAGILAQAHEDVVEEFEIDLNDEEPEFLKGHSTKSGIEMSPIKIVKNPEGSMQRAAMTQASIPGGGEGGWGVVVDSQDGVGNTQLWSGWGKLLLLLDPA